MYLLLFVVFHRLHVSFYRNFTLIDKNNFSAPPASAGYYPYVFSPVQANYMYPYGYYVPPGSPYSASSQYSQDGHFIYPPVYPYAYYPGDIYTGQEYQEVTAGGDAPVPEATKAE